jgi:hypothetical protein
LAAEEEAVPSTIIVSSSNDELDDDYWEKLGASFNDARRCLIGKARLVIEVYLVSE